MYLYIYVCVFTLVFVTMCVCVLANGLQISTSQVIFNDTMCFIHFFPYAVPHNNLACFINNDSFNHSGLYLFSVNLQPMFSMLEAISGFSKRKCIAMKIVYQQLHHIFDFFGGGAHVIKINNFVSPFFSFYEDYK